MRAASTLASARRWSGSGLRMAVASWSKHWLMSLVICSSLRSAVAGGAVVRPFMIGLLR
jgi:hypothetical protein